MAKDSMQTAVLDSQFLTTVWPYVLLIVIAVTSFQFLRLVISTIIAVVRLLVRVVVLVISWPIYLILIPARAFVFLTKLTIKITLYVAMAAIVYQLLGGALNFEMIKEAFGEGLFNLVGHQILLFFGGLTYILYIGSYLSYNAVFVISSGAIIDSVSTQCLECLRE